MALKDLVASKSALTEEAVEAFVKEYVRYDVEEREVTFLSAASTLSGKRKVLVYLVALQGWPFLLSHEDQSTSATPAQISERVGIHGGSLRPLLKELKDRHLIAWKDGAYSVRAASLPDLKREMDGAPSATKTDNRRRASEVSRSAGNGRPRRRASTKVGNLSGKFNGWIADGFFKEPRTLAQIQERFHEQGDIIPQTSIPTYLLAAVRAKPARLYRTKKKVDGKEVWVYTSHSA